MKQLGNRIPFRNFGRIIEDVYSFARLKLLSNRPHSLGGTQKKVRVLRNLPQPLAAIHKPTVTTLAEIVVK